MVCRDFCYQEPLVSQDCITASFTVQAGSVPSFSLFEIASSAELPRWGPRQEQGHALALCLMLPPVSLPLPAESLQTGLDFTPSMSPGLAQVLNKLVLRYLKEFRIHLGPLSAGHLAKVRSGAGIPGLSPGLRDTGNCSCKEVSTTGRKTAVALGKGEELSHLQFLFSLLPSEHHSANSQGLNNTCIQAMA